MSSPSAASSSSSNGNAFSATNTFTPQMSQLPPGMVDFNSLNLHSANSSAPASAASSPGWQHRRLPSGTHHTVGGGSNHGHSHHASPVTTNSRVAASSVTGKRLNWGEMICATIAHSEHGRLVIQDLFEQMCKRFPEVQEWAFGKDWEARVKNRIKSTLSIKGHLFIKVPRPSSAAGKGSWWTLSQEAKDAYSENRLGPLLKLSGTGPGSEHSRQSSRNDSLNTLGSNVTSALPSRYNSPGPGSGVATPIKGYAMPHPLTQHMEAANSNVAPSGAAAAAETSQQAQRAAQLAQLQAQLFQQQQQQREALPGSYDPNAPPSSAAHFPSNFWNFDGMGMPSVLSQGGFPSDSPAGSGNQSGQSSGPYGITPSDQDFMTQLQMSQLQAYSSSFGQGNAGGPLAGMAIPGKGRGGSGMGGQGSGGGGGNQYGTSAGEPMSMSFDPGSFGATLRALGAASGGWKGGPDSTSNNRNTNTSDSAFESSGGSASSTSAGYSNAGSSSRSGTVDNASSNKSSYGIGSPQSIAHLGGPQSMPFPAYPEGSRSRTTTAGTTTGRGTQDVTPNGTGSNQISNPFDFGSSTPSGGLAQPPPGPGGMYPYGPDSTQVSGDVSQGGGRADMPTDAPFGFPSSIAGMPGVGNNVNNFFALSPNTQAQYHNPFGVSIPGGYAMPGGPGQQPPWATNSFGDDAGQSTGGRSGSNAWTHQRNTSSLGSSDANDPSNPGGQRMSTSSSSSTPYPPPSPADSTSAFFAFTPAASAADAGQEDQGRPRSNSLRQGSERSMSGGEGKGEDSTTTTGEGESALGPLVGRRRAGSRAGAGGNPQQTSSSSSSTKGPPGLQKVEEGFSLPPSATSKEGEEEGKRKT